MKKQEMSIQVPRLFLLLFLSNPHCVGFTSVDSEPDKTEGRLCHSPRGKKSQTVVIVTVAPLDLNHI